MVSLSAASAWFLNSTVPPIGVGFGTAALRPNCYEVVKMALEAGFRKFDTAEEHEWWYDPDAVGMAVSDFFRSQRDDECLTSTGEFCSRTCTSENIRISTKIPPWSLTSIDDIRASASRSREQLVGDCEDIVVAETDVTTGETIETTRKYPLDVYYIHAPRCWDGWHTQCENPPATLELRDAWLALEAVVGVDHSAKRLGLSNVSPDELLDIIHFVKERQQDPHSYPPPRIPDVVQAMADPIYPAEDLRAVCRTHGIEFVSYSTLGTQHHSLQVNPVLTSPIVLGLAAKHERSVAEVVLSWALQNGMSVIPRSSKRQHIYELARLMKNPAFLDEGDMAQIDSMKQRRTY